MCYDIKTSLEKQLRRAILDGNEAQIAEINEKLSIFSPDKIELNHASGFDHPQLIIYTNDKPFKPQLAIWGLVPSFAKSAEEKNEIWNKTLNARGETIFEKKAFKDSAIHHRCLVYLEGFYEHYHYQGKTYPYFIQMKDKDLFAVAGLWSEFVDTETGELTKSFSLVTTKANREMAKIHNNPKIPESRMPLILPADEEEQWLINLENTEDITQLKKLIKPLADNQLHSYTVGAIKGKKALGNSPSAIEEKKYAELSIEQGSLF